MFKEIIPQKSCVSDGAILVATSTCNATFRGRGIEELKGRWQFEHLPLPQKQFAYVHLNYDLGGRLSSRLGFAHKKCSIS